MPHVSPTSSHAPTVRSSLLDYAVASDLAGVPEAAAAAVQVAGRLTNGACPWDPRGFMTPDAARIRQFAAALAREGRGAMAAAVRRVAEELDAETTARPRVH